MAAAAAELFLAWAGVIPHVGYLVEPVKAFPRMGGGDPYVIDYHQAIVSFSPHGRG